MKYFDRFLSVFNKILASCWVFWGHSVTPRSFVCLHYF